MSDEFPIQNESADGRVIAITHPIGGGVFLKADFSDLNPTPRKVRFVRGTDLLPVRSGDPTSSPGGYANAYDREAPGGVPSTWYAIPIFWDSGVYVEGDITLGAQVTSPAPDAERDFWLKSLGTPLHMRLRSTSAMTTMPERQLTGRDGGQVVPGQSYPSGSWDVPVYQPTTYVFKTHTAEEYTALELLLSSGPMLLQQYPLYGIPDEYMKFGSLTWRYQRRAIDPERVVSVTFNPCQRPPTGYSATYIPGHSWDDGDAAFFSWDDADSQVDTWDDLLVATLPPPTEIIPESGGEGDEGGP